MEDRSTNFHDAALTADEITRYRRQLILPEIGLEGQSKLKSARVLIIGAGALGSPVALYLAAAGIGTLGIVDGDTVDESNLHRQITHETNQVRRGKIAAAAGKIAAINPLVDVVPFTAFLMRDNALEIIADFDVVVDCSDNFPTRYLVNDACILSHKPNVFGAVYRFEGQASVFGAQDGPCYRCFFAEPPPPNTIPTCAESGVLGVLPGIIGCIQATETIKLLLNGKGTLTGRLLMPDAWEMRFREIPIKKNLRCPVCGDAPTQTGLIDYGLFCGMPSSPEKGAAAEIGSVELRDLIEKKTPLLRIIEIIEPHGTLLGALRRDGRMSYRDVAHRAKEFPPEGTVVFVCKFGIRSEAAVRALVESGYSGNVYSLRGGIFAWMREMEQTANGTEQ